jgi:hypothetical protein
MVQLDASRYEAIDTDATTHPDANARSAERGRRPFARIDGGPGLPDDVVERLLCAGRMRTVLRAGRGPNADILDLGRSHRLVTERQFRALLLRDGGCAHPGCTRKLALEAHHVRHWLRGGRTDLANLVLLCRRHHHWHHDGDFVIIARGGGRFDFLRTDGREIPTHIDPSELITDHTGIEQEHPTVAATAATPNWDGTLLDHDLAVWGIAQGLPGHDPRTRSAERADTAA